MNLLDFAQPHMSKEAEDAMLKAFDLAAEEQNALLEKAKHLE